jgi:hypothetical protein
MKKFLVALIILALSLASKAQSDALQSKTQQQIMDEFNSKSAVSLKYYPNPAVNYLVVEPEVNSLAGSVKIFDVLGNTKADIHLEAGINGFTVDLSEYQPGLYILAYYDGGNKLLHIGRFYKN